MNRPSFQFYPADWSANSNLRRCTHEEKGIWIDVMCLLHDQEEYGIARWPLKEIAQAIGSTVAKLRGLVTKGVIKGGDVGQQSEALVYVPRSGRKDGTPVTLIDVQAGPIWFSSRMVIDEYKRVVRGEYGATPKPTPDSSPKGGIGATPKPTPDPSPSRAHASSSSSSSSSVNLKTKPQAAALDQLAPGEPPPTAAAVRFAVAIRAWEKARGKMVALQAQDPRLQAWVDAGITDDQLALAYEWAVDDRATKGDNSPVNAGFLDVFVAKVLKPVTGTSAIGKLPAPKQWFMTSPGIEAKAIEIGVAQLAGEQFYQFKARVFAAAGVTEEQVRKARIDAGEKV